MPSGNNNTLDCPGCGAENLRFASFCIVCGEPFDVPGDADFDFLFPNDAPPEPPKVERAQPTVKDRAPASLSSRLARRETIIGLALVLLVVGYAIGDWQRSVAQSAAYKEGITAEQKKDWDKAADAFERAGDQRDAGNKAGHARFQVAERDRLYAEAIAAADRQDWNAVVPDLEGVQAIQPAFADSAERLVQARSQAFKLELGDLIYSVGDGPDAGLYMLDESSQPYRLPGSDGQSSVRAMSPDGARFIYDRPKSYTDYSVSAPGKGTLPNSFNDVTVKRIPVLVTVQDGKIATRPLPDLNGGGTGTFSERGLWWYSGWYSTPRDGDYLQYEIAYSDEGRDVVRTVAVTNPFSATRALALDPARSRLVLGEGRGAPRTIQRHTRIMLADADGTNPLDVGSVDGDVQTAWVSRDGRWLLALTQHVIARVGIEHSVWLVPLEAGAGVSEPGVGRLETTSVSNIEIPPRLTAAFVPSDEKPARVVVDRTGADAERLTLYYAGGAYTDADILKNSILYRLPDESTGYDSQGFSNGGRYLGLRRQTGSKAMLEVIDLSDADLLRSHSMMLPAQKGQTVKVSFAPLDNYVLASVQSLDGPEGDHERTIYVAHMSNDGTLGELKAIATASTQSERALPAVAFTSGGTLLAYVNADRQLRVTFYDGERDTLIAEGVSAVWALGQPGDPSRP